MSNKKPHKQRMGRPPAPRDEVRGQRIVTFLTESQFAELKKLAKRRGTSLSGACYQLLQSHLE